MRSRAFFRRSLAALLPLALLLFLFGARVPLRAIAPPAPARSFYLDDGQVVLAGNMQAPPAAPGGPNTLAGEPARLTDDAREDDFSSLAVDSDGTVWAVWQSYSGLRDEIRVRRYSEGRWHTFTRVPGISGDVWRPQVAVDANHTLWVVWAQQVAGNWDLYARPFDGHQWLPEVRLTSDPLPDLNAQVTTSAGDLVVIWQGFRPGVRAQSDIFLKRYDHYAKQWSPDTRVSTDTANDWDPAVACDGQGNAWVAWDTYAAGNYDVYVRQVPLRANGTLPEPIKVAATDRAEMRAAVACDRANRVWIACESARPNWGKDNGYTIRQNPPGVPLGGPRGLAVRVVENGRVREPAGSIEDAMPAGEKGFFFTPHLLADTGGRIWMTVRHRSNVPFRNAQGVVQQRVLWQEWLTRWEGDHWNPATVLPRSLGRQTIYSSIAAAPDGAVWLAWTTDNRQLSDPHRPIHDEVYALFTRAAGPAREPALREISAPPAEDARRAGHTDEPGDLRAIREYRVRISGKTHQIVRGDLHRHTEFSWDSGGGNDGSVLDFYRYMIDVAAMDYGAITDHNAGGDFEYWWWINEKLADLFHVPSAYVPLFAYERSVVFPNGHRNIVHAYRGVPVVSFFTQPELTGSRPGIGTGAVLDNDTKLLYGEIRRTRGIAIPHTSATRMGTDWRDNDRELEPVVELFQGARTNYEYAGAPKSADPQRDAQHVQQAGYEPDGFVWNAWKRGYRLGVITSSDHGSTHISYAMVYTPAASRDAILDSIRKRHTYGATDNIILEFRMGDAFMGDEITVRRLPSLAIRVRGTRAVSRLDIVRNNAFLLSTEPKNSEVRLVYRDLTPSPGLSYYYVRVQQEDGQIAWSSPIWVNLKP